MQRLLPLIAMALIAAALPSWLIAQEPDQWPANLSDSEEFFQEPDADQEEQADEDDGMPFSPDVLVAARETSRPHADQGKPGEGKPWWTTGKGKAGKDKHAQPGQKHRGMKGHPKGKRPSAEQIFKRLDANGDQQLSLDEFKKGMEKLHARMGRSGPGRRGPDQAANRGPGRRGPGPVANRGPGKPGPRHLAMRGRPSNHGPKRPGPGAMNEARLATFHLAQYHLAMYRFHGGKPVPGIMGPAHPGKPGPRFAAPGKPGPRHLAMRSGPPARRPAPPCVKGPQRPRGGMKPMKHPGHGGPRGPQAAMVQRMLRVANAIFDRVDANKDGKVNALEAAAAHKKHFARVLEKVDRDGDQAIGKREAVVSLVGLVKRIHASHAGPAKGPQDPGKCPAMKGHTPGKPDRAKAKAAMAERFKKADANGDGKLSREEAPPRLKERFGQIDANGDGQLTKDELKAAFAARHKDAPTKPRHKPRADD
ncbi:MAG: hypothetical protein JW719_13365 [Pirellulales bacterium]|nr:hypothetical protein [Pirellulales bacterium]